MTVLSAFTRSVLPVAKHGRPLVLGRARIRVATVINAPPRSVWASIRDIATHSGDGGRRIRFTSPEQAARTTFECDTRDRPLQPTTFMEVTEWDERTRIGIARRLVTGSGRSRCGGARGAAPAHLGREAAVPLVMGGPRRWRRRRPSLAASGAATSATQGQVEADA